MKAQKIARQLKLKTDTDTTGELFLDSKSICARLPDTKDGQPASVTIWWEGQRPYLINENCVVDSRLDSLREIVKASN